jgi:hypothetical protein
LVVPALQVWVVASQQPVEQLSAVHTQLWSWPHSVPAGHSTQTTPPLPQAPLAVPGSQTPFWQQPLGQLAGVHTHEPFWHSSPGGHATQATPPVPQAWLVSPVRHVLPSQQPVEQLAVVHTQVPLLLHSSPAGHATQATPLVPQCWLLLVWH